MEAGRDLVVVVVIGGAGGGAGIKKNAGSNEPDIFFRGLDWLPRRDSNPNKQNQNLRCYHYTTRQQLALSEWRGRRGSNPQPPDRQSSALTNCATTPRSRKRCILYHFSLPECKGKNELFSVAVRTVSNYSGLCRLRWVFMQFLVACGVAQKRKTASSDARGGPVAHC